MRFNHPRINQYLLEEYGTTWKTCGIFLLKEAINSIQNKTIQKREWKELNARRKFLKLTPVLFEHGHPLHIPRVAIFNKVAKSDMDNQMSYYLKTERESFILDESQFCGIIETSTATI